MEREPRRATLVDLLAHEDPLEQDRCAEDDGPDVEVNERRIAEHRVHGHLDGVLDRPRRALNEYRRFTHLHGHGSHVPATRREIMTIRLFQTNRQKRQSDRRNERYARYACGYSITLRD